MRNKTMKYPLVWGDNFYVEKTAIAQSITKKKLKW